MAAKTHSIFDPAIIVPAIGESFKKLNPVTMLKNPVMFVTEVGAVVTTVLMFTRELRVRRSDFFCRLLSGFGSRSSSPILPRPWPRAGKSAGQTLRKARTQTFANRIKGDSIEKVAAEQLRKEDLVIVKAGEVIPGDGEVIEGAATVDESAITGESAPCGRLEATAARDWRHACSRHHHGSRLESG